MEDDDSRPLGSHLKYIPPSSDEDWPPEQKREGNGLENKHQENLSVEHQRKQQN